MEINWSEAPEWADKVCLASKPLESPQMLWVNDDQYIYIEGVGNGATFGSSCYKESDLELVENRPDAW